VHLTRRGRALAVLVFAAVLLGAFSLGRTASQAAAPTSPVAATTVEQTTVEPGDSLWSVARRVAPDNDPREVVEQIRRLNDLPSAHIQAGQQLLLPVAA
jgi:LysM repeat protein